MKFTQRLKTSKTRVICFAVCAIGAPAFAVVNTIIDGAERASNSSVAAIFAGFSILFAITTVALYRQLIKSNEEHRKELLEVVRNNTAAIEKIASQ